MTYSELLEKSHKDIHNPSVNQTYRFRVREKVTEVNPYAFDGYIDAEIIEKDLREEDEFDEYSIYDINTRVVTIYDRLFNKLEDDERHGKLYKVGEEFLFRSRD